MLLVYVQRWACASGSFIIYEANAGVDLFVVNRGIVVGLKENREVLRFQSGDYFGAAQLLQIRRTYQFTARAETMCHLLKFDRESLMTCLKTVGDRDESRNQAIKSWFATTKEREQRRDEEEQRKVKEAAGRR